MACSNQVGVRNVLITFTDCDTGETLGPISHKLADEDSLPEVKSCAWSNTALTHGRVQRTTSNASINMSVIPQDTLPLSYYQGCAAIDVQIEYFSGRVYVGKGGSVIDNEGSDLKNASMNIIFPSLHEDLPANSTQAA